MVLAMTGTFMIVELVAGWYTHSLALMADAGHMLSDVASMSLALLAIWFATRPPTTGKSYGYYRTEILASLINGVLLVVVSLGIFFEAYRRISAPPDVMTGPMLAVALVGLFINLISIKLLHAVQHDSVNMQAAYLEVMSDLAGSAGVLIAAVTIMFTGWHVVDPLVSALIGLLILPRTWLLLAEATNILMEGTPGHIDPDELREKLLAVAGVIDVHDIHVWTITSGLESMSVHITVCEGTSSKAVLSEVTRICQSDFGIQHTTIQIEQLEEETEQTPEIGQPSPSPSPSQNPAPHKHSHG
jgi:cobalt-zinc-cadmium efflux system protein